MLEYLENDFREGMTSPKHYQYPQEKHYLKVTDTATNAIAAYGVWIYLPQGYHAEEDDEVIVHPLPKGSNEDLMREFCRMTGVLRSEHPGRKEAHWCT